MHILLLLNIFFVNIIAFKINYRSLTLDCPQTPNPQKQSVIYAHKTGTGNTRNGRDGKPKYLGLKRFHNSFVYTGNIIVRQRGAHFKPGIGTTMGRDYTISASRCGKLQILRRRISVLDLVAEQDAIEKAKQTDYYRHPTILTLSKLWMQQKS